MDARLFRPARSVRTLCAATMVFLLSGWSFQSAQAQLLRTRGQMPIVRHQPPTQAVAHSENFIVFASSPDWANQVIQAAEDYRRELAVHWLGKELPTWSERCPIHVTAAGNLGASGETRFSPIATGVGNWMMSVNGTPERILDSVLPHEISHTILASHFARFAQRGQFVPRWADEGACTTVEHESEKRKHRHYLHEFLKNGRGLAFNKMFRLKEYPDDILPLYAQGHSAVQFLIDQGNAREFIVFLERGMTSGNWEAALKSQYGYESIGQFQYLWNKWLFDGSPDELVAYSPKLQASQPDVSTSLASSRGTPSQLKGKLQFAIGNTDPAPVHLASQQQPAGSPNSDGNDSWYKRRLEQVSQDGNGPSTLNASPAGANLARVTPPEQLAAEVLPDSGRTQIRTPDSIRILEEPSPLPNQPVLASNEASNEWNGVSTPVDTSPFVLAHGTSRPQPAQTTQVQVLQWGAGTPPLQRPSTGLQSVVTPASRTSSAIGEPVYGSIQMVPIYR